MKDLPDSLTDDETIVEKIIMCLDSIGVDAESFKNRQLRERQTSFKKAVAVANQSVDELVMGKTFPTENKLKPGVFHALF